jgi:hypothetical protein
MLMKRIIRLTESELIKVVRRVITEQEITVNVIIRGDVQKDCDTCPKEEDKEEQISYLIFDFLRKTSLDPKDPDKKFAVRDGSYDDTYANFEIEKYTGDINNVKSTLETKLKEITGEQITCTVNGNNLTCNL